MATHEGLSVREAFETALGDVETTQADTAAVRLAQGYADAIDEDQDKIGRYGPLLLDAMRELGMTPKARRAVVKGTNGDSATGSKWDELEARRAARVDGSAAVDPAAP